MSVLAAGALLPLLGVEGYESSHDIRKTSKRPGRFHAGRHAVRHCADWAPLVACRSRPDEGQGSGAGVLGGWHPPGFQQRRVEFCDWLRWRLLRARSHHTRHGAARIGRGLPHAGAVRGPDAHQERIPVQPCGHAHSWRTAVVQRAWRGAGIGRDMPRLPTRSTPMSHQRDSSARIPTGWSTRAPARSRRRCRKPARRREQRSCASSTRSPGPDGPRLSSSPASRIFQPTSPRSRSPPAFWYR